MKVMQNQNQHTEVSVSDFSISETLECGQCFRFQKLAPLEYGVMCGQHRVRIQQENQTIHFFGASEEDVTKIWIPYFDLSRNYADVKEILAKKDDIMAQAVCYASGIRILRQNFFECLISFILSQNNHIPRIKKLIETICQEYGEKIGKETYAFPTQEQLKSVSEAEFRRLGTGFRAKYLVDAVSRVVQGEFPEEQLRTLSTEDLRERLMKIYGVGRKVADCVLLFSFERYEVFPTDVWVKRIMSQCYFSGQEVPLKEIFQMAKEKYGDYAGFAQQYLFHYARKQGIGKKG